MAEKQALAPHIARQDGVRGGRPFIDGTGITIDHLVREHEHAHWTIDEIADQHELTLAQVHAALAYYWDHKAEVDQWMVEDDAFVDLCLSNR